MPFPVRRPSRSALTVLVAEVVVIGLGLTPMYREDGRSYLPLAHGSALCLLVLVCLLVGIVETWVPSPTHAVRRAGLATVASLTAVGLFVSMSARDAYSSMDPAFGFYLTTAAVFGTAVAATATLGRRASVAHPRLTGAVVGLVAGAATVSLLLYTAHRDNVGFPMDELWLDTAIWSFLYAVGLGLFGMTLGTLTRRRWAAGACWSLGPIGIVLAAVWTYQHQPELNELFA